MTPPARSHCREPDACKASKPTTHCRRCAALRLHADPDVEAKRRAAADAYFARPEVTRLLAERIRKAQREALADPAYREQLREYGRRQYREYLSRPDVRARNASPEVRRRAGERVTETRLADVPPELRGEYRRLVREKGLSAAEARMVVRDMPGSELRAARRAIDAIDREQRARRRRERAQAY